MFDDPPPAARRAVFPCISEKEDEMSRTTIRNLVIAATLTLLIGVIVTTCRPAPAQNATGSDVRIASAHQFTQRYSQSRLSGWNVRASAAGVDCAVLFVRANIILEDSMIEAMHYGAGAYDIYDGGVQHFYRERAFRGVAYQDSSGRVWTYGAVNATEAEALKPCR
jgi:hypothetical protein